jgi:CBS domain-containing protein
MEVNRFTEEPWATGEVGDLVKRIGRQDVITVNEAEHVGDAVGQMTKHGISQLPVLNGEGALVGIVTETDVLASLFADHCTMETVIAEVMCRQVATVRLHDKASLLAQAFGRGETAIVIDDSDRLIGILSKMDLIRHLAGTAGQPA